MKAIVIESPWLCDKLSWTIEVYAITLWPFIITRDKSNKKGINHEMIHIKQQAELLVVFFFLFYVIHWLYNFAKYTDSYDAYMAIIFEKEAYKYEKDYDYLNNRKLYAYWRSGDI